MKAILFTDPARRQFAKLPAEAQKAISDKLGRYAKTGAGDVKAISGTDSLRLRVGDYRVIFTATSDAIDVVAVAHRRDIYR